MITQVWRVWMIWIVSVQNCCNETKFSFDLALWRGAKGVKSKALVQKKIWSNSLAAVASFFFWFDHLRCVAMSPNAYKKWTKQSVLKCSKWSKAKHDSSPDIWMLEISKVQNCVCRRLLPEHLHADRPALQGCGMVAAWLRGAAGLRISVVG